MTVSRDLSDLNETFNSPRPKTANNPKGSGRKKGPPKPKAEPKPRQSQRGKETPKLDIAREIVRALLDANQPISPHKLEKEHGISHVTFDMAITAELARRETIEDKAALDSSLLSKSAQEKLKAALKAHKKQLDAEFEGRVRAECRRRMEATFLPHYRESEAHYEAVIKGRKGVFTDAEYNLILHCTHTDSRKSLSDERLNQALHLLQSKKLVLVAERENPTRTVDIPKTFDEMTKQKAGV